MSPEGAEYKIVPGKNCFNLGCYSKNYQGLGGFSNKHCFSVSEAGKSQIQVPPDSGPWEGPLPGSQTSHLSAVSSRGGRDEEAL